MGEKRVLLIVGGGVAAYKALLLTRLLRKAGVAVRPILTKAGAAFVTPLSLAALAEDKVYEDLFSLTDEHEMGHIELSRSADLVVVAPATADLIAKAAQGLAGDLASTTLLATDKPVLMAPAMNVRMWLHPATQRNIATLEADGVRFVGPEEGAMACGEFGPGRLAEPEAIFAAIMAALEGPAARPLEGKRALVTAGPTFEPIDPVRGITNRSSGKQGFAIAEALAKLGAEVTLIAGPVALPTPPGVRRIDVETARQMLAASQAALPADVGVFVAAVADWRVDEAFGSKLKKEKGGPPALTFVENPDILATLSASGPHRPRLVVGFAAETDHVEEHARAKLARKGCDWIIANDVTEPGVMGGGENAVLLVTKTGTERWDRAAKDRVAAQIAQRIAEALG
ncbi:bifunctional phosphopantothenoylcysteine decarboxylase/phosphopantothenate--cysteine ligase CoaBC [Caulobacter vibrioides]|uniref:Coenzyme A biosynthesis bifunctional protein CoaBC n=1 Tax=Caulobacter vibrioides (strain NA1000 / CB15N) TaxID=565050 RepID=A0A0H3CEG5_CAUVN|nr:bifunctional phosphopantothenoylcysteine decarboxylase/phosphopantothenate--cysteine ligase CoaBC [Caulobacter vibrioides]YP_002519200.2 bifunctional phosphopantothenoylcysteine decarboxylase/phosphopantothenate synthase [Caulobacter vibrioides NA1000]ACL97292.2 bifunctional phosphopantothenoylcysteine decarboxylase/phosphopantothenate synthase [Caulobacter vibrioides NA1000]QXZ52048.1 bifunctional phosphopantothenoylcysteine decarboxylase/phosphopantothenate--cysteine ligase CoaBC [Caulobact